MTVATNSMTVDQARESLFCGIGILESGARGRDARSALRMVARAYDALAAAHDGQALEAAYVLGLCLVHGVGVQKDEKRGVAIIERVAGRGYMRAGAYLAERAEQEWLRTGDRRQARTALAAWRSLALAGDTAARIRLADLYVTLGTCLDEALGIYERASRAGDAHAARMLADMLADGRGGVFAPDRAGDILARVRAA